jgi:hypothetical protein
MHDIGTQLAHDLDEAGDGCGVRARSYRPLEVQSPKDSGASYSRRRRRRAEHDLIALPLQAVRQVPHVSPDAAVDRLMDE